MLYYEIRVAGELPAEALADFSRLNAAVELAETVIRGSLPDQAALSGLLTRLEVAGVQVTELRRLGPARPRAARSGS